MKKLLAVWVCFALAASPLYAGSPGSSAPAGTPSFLEAVEVAAASGVYRAQNTSTITTGRIREGDKKRSALAYGLSGVMAFAGAALWRWIPCRNASSTDLSIASSVEQAAYHKCYDADGMRKGFDTPTKWMLGAGIGLKAVSLFYLIAHLTSDGDDP